MKHFTGTAAGMLALALCGSALASSHAAPETLQFTSISKSTVFSPAVSKSSPPRIGGQIVFPDTMYNRGAQLGKSGGARVGRSIGVCTLVSSKRPEAQCVITAHLPNGDLVVVGEGDPGGKVTRYAITGGVGAYANASGTVTATAVNEEKTIVVVKLAA